MKKIEELRAKLAAVLDRIGPTGRFALAFIAGAVVF